MAAAIQRLLGLLSVMLLSWREEYVAARGRQAVVLWPRDECEMEETKGELLGALAYLLLDLHFSSLLACLGICCAFGGKGPLYRPFCIGRVSFSTQHA
jgi:hypothetical protein